MTIRFDRFKLGLSLFWFLFTFSMVTWWWIFSLRQLQSSMADIEPAKFQSLHRMILWEGFILLCFVSIGGLSLLFLTNQERLRNLKLRLFFSNFSHDLKTSLSRLRLRAEVLEGRETDPGIQKLLAEVNRLDLQLENSLWLARAEDQKLLVHKCLVSELISSLRVEWPEIEIHLQRDAVLFVDPQAMKSILRNLFQNASIHGQARKVELNVHLVRPQQVQLTFRDDGQGYAGDVKLLGTAILPSRPGQSNGLGLYLTRSLLKKMRGRLEFESVGKGFAVKIGLPGDLRDETAQSTKSQGSEAETS